jgi:2,4-dienoyl-CoA reductase-like NADH-dependent reductase (Old Yellow Enzyme family)
MKPDIVFQPFRLKSLDLRNRIVMPAMTRSFSPNGVPGENVADYYTCRAEGEVGLILSEGTVVDRPASSNGKDIPHFYGKQALSGWQKVIDSVHEAGGQMGPQLWHMGIVANHQSGWLPSVPFEGPSEFVSPGVANGRPMNDSDIADTITAFGRAAADAKRLGFDCVEIHGAHGYLIDQFFWSVTNTRSDSYGGKTLGERTRFAADVIREVRRQIGNDLALIIRISQFKLSDYSVKLANTPGELESWLAPLADAGVDIVHCSQRRFWEPEFEDSDLNLAGWAKKITGKATITVGSVGLDSDILATFGGESSGPTSLDELTRRFDRGDFDLVSVGRALLGDAEWPKKIKEGRYTELKPFSRNRFAELT